MLEGSIKTVGLPIQKTMHSQSLRILDVGRNGIPTYILDSLSGEVRNNLIQRGGCWLTNTEANRHLSGVKSGNR
jgi:hypothetical protein